MTSAADTTWTESYKDRALREWINLLYPTADYRPAARTTTH